MWVFLNPSERGIATATRSVRRTVDGESITKPKSSLKIKQIKESPKAGQQNTTLGTPVSQCKSNSKGSKSFNIEEVTPCVNPRNMKKRKRDKLAAEFQNVYEEICRNDSNTSSDSIGDVKKPKKKKNL